MTKKATLAVLLGLLVAGPAEAKEDKWTLADLQAAAKDGLWLEGLEHLGDVKPSERTDAWKKVAEEIALGFMEYCAKQEDPISALMMGEAILMKYPTVRKSRAIMNRRNEIGMKGFAKCYEHAYAGGECTEVLGRFVEGDPGNAELALGAGKLVRRNQFHYNAAPFFKRAVAWGKAKKATICKDSDLSMAVVAGLGLPTDYDLAKDSRELADSCFVELKKAILAELKPDSTGYLVDNACPILKAKNTPHKACDKSQARK